MEKNKTKIFISSILLLFLLVNFAVCEKNETKTKADNSWITKGTIDMKALVTMDELWEKQIELEGKVVTLELGEASSSYNGNSDPIKGVCYYHTGMHFNKISNQERKNINTYLKKESIEYQANDTLFLGSYSVNTVNKGKINGDIPEWIKYKSEIIDFDRDKDLYPFQDANKKILTGILLGIYNNYYEMSISDSVNIYMSRRYFEIYPLGIEFLKEEKISN